MNSLWWRFTCCNEYWDELLRKYADNVFCVVSRNVRCDLKNTIQICLLLEIVWNDSFSWSCLIISSSIVFDRLISLLTNDACIFSIIEWRMFVLDLSNDVYDETSFMKHLIKLEKNDSSNLTKATHQIWRKRFIKTWREQRHLIKFDDSVISSNLRSSSHQTFEETNDFSTFDERSHVTTRDMKNLVLQKITFVMWNCYDK
jgi:hypothetical protein